MTDAYERAEVLELADVALLPEPVPAKGAAGAVASTSRPR